MTKVPDSQQSQKRADEADDAPIDDTEVALAAAKRFMDRNPEAMRRLAQ